MRPCPHPYVAGCLLDSPCAEGGACPCVYVLADPRDGEIRYVGQTGDAAGRSEQHVTGRNLSWSAHGRWVFELSDAIRAVLASRAASRRAWALAERTAAEMARAWRHRRTVPDCACVGQCRGAGSDGCALDAAIGRAL